jgi:hypothetical protein
MMNDVECLEEFPSRYAGPSALTLATSVYEIVVCRGFFMASRHVRCAPLPYVCTHDTSPPGWHRVACLLRQHNLTRQHVVQRTKS